MDIPYLSPFLAQQRGPLAIHLKSRMGYALLHLQGICYFCRPQSGETEMDTKKLVETVSGGTGVAPDSVKKVIDSAFETIGKQAATGDAVKIHGFGTFKSKAAKEGGETKVVFRPWLTKDEKATKKKKKLEKKETKAKKT
jgi:nucleoid DNA-binding protein